MKTMRSKIVAFALLCCVVMTLCSTAQAQISVSQLTKSKQKFVSFGRLIRSGRTRDGSPRFALLDDHGSISSFVMAAAGTNLSDYVGKEVGITVRAVSENGQDLPYYLAEKATLVSVHDPTARASEGTMTLPKGRVPVGGGVELAHLQERLGAADDVSHVSGPEWVDVPDSVPLPTDESILANPTPMSQGVVYGIDDPSASAAGVTPLVGSSVISDDIIDGPMIGDPRRAGGNYGDPGCESGASCPCGSPGRYWARGEYLLWWTKGMNTPALVTTSPADTPTSDIGVLPNATVLFGGGDILDSTRSGARFRIGGWCDCCQWYGFETEYFFLSEESDGFQEFSSGQPSLARPFFNTDFGEDAELIAATGVVTGSVRVRSDSELQSFAPRFRMNICCDTSDCDLCGPAGGCGLPVGNRMDLLLGYRYLNLEDGLSIDERLATVGAPVSTFDLTDSFDTENEFHGFEIGLLWERYRGPWSLELLGRLAIGNNRRTVVIDGSTISSSGGVTFNDTGGLLAQTSNIGRYTDDDFAVLPQLEANLGFALTPRLRALVGYSFLYLSDVVRAGDQIDRTVDPDIIPPALDPNATRPAFAFNESSFWAQGLSLGLDYRW